MRLLSTARAAARHTDADTTILVDRVQVTAIKQGTVLRSQPVAATILGSRVLEGSHVGAVKHLSQRVPNLHIPDYGSAGSGPVSTSPSWG